jgi:diadenosine tetraphosphate (Ap4A) HIT family hydrolase
MIGAAEGVSAEECVFCAIIRGDLEASFVHQDERVVAFADIQPITPGHLLVVPRVHAVGLEDLAEEIGARVWMVAHRLARALRRSDLNCEGVNLFLADGEAALQDVFHVHLHVFPRFAEDRFRIDTDRQLRPRPELDRTAGLVRQAWASLFED